MNFCAKCLTPLPDCPTCASPSNATNCSASSDTPRTDAAWEIHTRDSLASKGDPWQLASDLERECNKTRAALREANLTVMRLNSELGHGGDDFPQND